MNNVPMSDIFNEQMSNVKLETATACEQRQQ